MTAKKPRKYRLTSEPISAGVVQLMIVIGDQPPPSGTLIVDFEVDGKKKRAIGLPSQGVPVPAGAKVVGFKIEGAAP